MITQKQINNLDDLRLKEYTAIALRNENVDFDKVDNNIKLSVKIMRKFKKLTGIEPSEVCINGIAYYNNLSERAKNSI